MRSALLKLLTVLVLASIYAFAASPRQWSVLGPDGGDVRSLAYDPQNPGHVFLGTNTGVIFVLEDGGHSWSRFAKLGTGDDYVLDHIAFDPQNSKTIFARLGAYRIRMRETFSAPTMGARIGKYCRLCVANQCAPWRFRLPIIRS